MKPLNRNDTRRKEILAPYMKLNPTSKYDTAYISDIPLHVLVLLQSENFLDVQCTQNDSPTIEEFMHFMSIRENCYAHGYIVSPDREDYRISIEGLKWESAAHDLQCVKDFAAFCQGADELDLNNMFSWWD